MAALLLLAAAVRAVDAPSPTRAELERSGYATPAPLAAKNLLLHGARIGKRLVAAGEHGHVLLSDDDGASWRQARSVPTVTTLTALTFADERRGWAVGHGGIVIGTGDGGETWTLLSGKLDGPDTLLSVWFSADGAQGLAVGAFGYAASSRDGGRTWQRVEVAEGEDGERHLNAVFTDRDGTLWLAAEAGTLFRSQDNGETWAATALPYKGSIWGGRALADGSLLVWGMRGNVLRSDDGGRTFAVVPTGTDQSIAGGTQLADGTVVLAGLGGAVLASRDGGRTFASTIRDDRVATAAVLPGAKPGEVLLLGAAGVTPHALAAAPAASAGTASVSAAPANAASSNAAPTTAAEPTAPTAATATTAPTASPPSAAAAPADGAASR